MCYPSEGAYKYIRLLERVEEGSGEERNREYRSQEVKSREGWISVKRQKESEGEGRWRWRAGAGWRRQNMLRHELPQEHRRISFIITWGPSIHA